MTRIEGQTHKGVRFVLEQHSADLWSLDLPDFGAGFTGNSWHECLDKCKKFVGVNLYPLVQAEFNRIKKQQEKERFERQ